MISRKPKPKAGKSPAKAPQKRFGQTDKRVHSDLYAAIIDHSLSPGTALQEDALATAFGVSRTVIRKVLQQLALERLVDIVPNRGASVAKPTAEEARQVFEARRVVERILVEKAMAHASDADIADLIATAKSEQLAFEAGNKQERVKLSGDFHRRLAKLGGNQVLGDFLNELVSRTSLIIALYESPGAVPCSHSEHLEIADAMKRRDVAKAVQYMEHHLLHIEAQTDLTDMHQKVDFRDLFGAAE
jgi:DNA-binding GntR family transcriptional regulator